MKSDRRGPPGVALTLGAVLASIVPAIHAAPPFDPAFGTDGRVTFTVLGTGWQPRHLHQVLAVPGGGYYLVGAVGAPGVTRNAPSLVRITDAGAPDPAFGDQGLFVHNFGVGVTQASVEAHDAVALAEFEREVDAVSEAPLRLTVAARVDDAASGKALVMFRVRIDRVHQDGFE